MKLSLYENAKSYLEESLLKAVAAKTDDRQWKFAISNLVQAVELFFKERLRREHEWLIYTDIDKRTQTVSIKDAAKRLNDLCQLNIDCRRGKKAKPDSDLLLAVHCRNDIIHGGVTIDADRKYLFFRILNYISNFCDLQFGLSVKDVCSEAVWEDIISDRTHIEEQYNTAIKVIQEKDYFHVIDCPVCGFETFVLEDEINTCFTCQHKDSIYWCDECGIAEFGEGIERGDSVVCIDCCIEIDDAQAQEDAIMDRMAYEHYHGRNC